MLVSEVPGSKGLEVLLAQARSGDEDSAWAGEGTGVCFLLPPALEVILKGIAQRLTANEVQSLSS